MMSSQQCETCRDPLTPMPTGRAASSPPFEDWLTCVRCDRAVAAYNAKINQAGDSNFVYHELAHFIVLFRWLPRVARDWKRIDRAIDPMTLGRAQVHELRTLTLQFVAHGLLGWRPSIKDLVELSWFGLVEARDSHVGGRDLVDTRDDAEARVAALVPKVSARNVKMYVNAVKQLRGET